MCLAAGIVTSLFVIHNMFDHCNWCLKWTYHQKYPVQMFFTPPPPLAPFSPFMLRVLPLETTSLVNEVGPVLCRIALWDTQFEG